MQKTNKIKSKLASSPFLYYWKQGLQDGFYIKHPVENHLSKKNAVSILRLWSRSLRGSLKHRSDFLNVQNYCIFFGHERSGHSLVGSLLDAHPNAIISHEVNALKLIAAGFSKHQVFSLLLENSTSYGRKGRGESGYSYSVPGQWQGDFESLKVIGDKDARRDTNLLYKFPKALGALKRKMKKIKIIVVLRNPFDNISTLCTRNKITEFPSQQRIDHYFSRCSVLKMVRDKVEDHEIYFIKHEDIIAKPHASIKSLCSFLELDSPQEYLEACASIMFNSPNKSRHKLQWNPTMIEQVNSQIKQYDFLDSYTFDS